MTSPPKSAGEAAGDAGLLRFETLRHEIMEKVPVLPPVETPVEEGHGRVLAEDVRAPSDLPPFPSSAMDGFAVRAADVAAARLEAPVALAVAGEAPAGVLAPRLELPGTAVRIATGAPVPERADAIVPIEDCLVEGERVLVQRAPERGAFVRPSGEDARAGEVLVRTGRRLLAPEMGVLAAAAVTAVRVHRPVRVGILSTGDEVVEPGEDAGPGRIPDSNGRMLRAAVLEGGGVPVPAGIVPDDPRALRDLARSLLSRVDAVVSSGGVSVGERDPVKLALADELAFHRVAMQPGMPQAFGVIDGRPWFGLPGNPVSVFVSFEVFVRPALLRMMGRRDPCRPEIQARLAEGIDALPDKTRFARVRLERAGGKWVATATGSHRSNLLTTVARADGLAIVPPGDGLPRGAVCRVIRYREG